MFNTYYSGCSLLVPFVSVETIVVGVAEESAMVVCVTGANGIEPRTAMLVLFVIPVRI